MELIWKIVEILGKKFIQAIFRQQKKINISIKPLKIEREERRGEDYKDIQFAGKTGKRE